MENVNSRLKVKVIKATNLVIRDSRSSDPYVRVIIGNQAVKTSVKGSDLNPCWNEELTLTLPEQCPLLQLKLFDSDMFNEDDPMGHATVDLERLISLSKVYEKRHPKTNHEEIGRTHPSKENGLLNESVILLTNEGVKQLLQLKLKDVESGEIEIELHLIRV
eukprot:TRINITY_DN4967_c0_g1_i1.p1 TRINITY_DN4967_c0_g1~~TRINITY_DN4967_c0_g1_i1.p1  ORF type:complete len:162 (-),score=28.79 TRINITY_DN4967_c0_g1_i1:60-545(-)